MGLFSGIKKLAAPIGAIVGGYFGGPSGASLGSSIGAGIAGQDGQERTNEANSAQAQRQMDFQERMSNTSWQRGMTDMRAAGLNPIFAYKAGGASTPNGAMAVMQNEQAAGVDAFSKTANSAQGLSMLKTQINNIKAQTTLTNTQGGKVVAEAHESAARAAQYTEQKNLTAAHTAAQKMQNQVTAAGLELALSKEAFAAENKDWVKYERILKGIGQVFGMGNSAAGTYNLLK